MLLVEVEATSANVCVGFDVLGISLNLTNKFTFEKSDEFKFKGFDEIYCTKENNMVYDAYMAVFKKLNMKEVPVEIGFVGDIPVSRGLGSSSSLIVAGVFGANYMAGSPYNKDELFNICVELEGHPDNVAPAVYGGLVGSYKYNGEYIPNFYEVDKGLKFITVIPPYKLSTHHAREVMPLSYSREDVVNNLSRIINIPHAFSKGDLNELFMLFDDKIHEPYRKTLIKEYDSLKKLCSDHKLPFAISGSGSTMLIISKDDEIIKLIDDKEFLIHSLTVGDGVKLKEV